MFSSEIPFRLGPLRPESKHLQMEEHKETVTNEGTQRNSYKWDSKKESEKNSSPDEMFNKPRIK